MPNGCIKQGLCDNNTLFKFPIKSRFAIKHCLLQQINCNMSFRCPYCNHKPFATRRALTQHQQRNVACQSRLKDAMGATKGYTTCDEFMEYVAVNALQHAKLMGQHDLKQGLMAAQLGAMAQNSMAKNATAEGYATAREYDSDGPLIQFPEENYEALDDDESQNEDEDAVIVPPNNLPPLTTIRDDWNKYCQKAQKNVFFQKDRRAALELMLKLRQTKASLETYNTIMEWHLKTIGALHYHEKVGGKKHFLSRYKLFKYLRKRYNMDENYNNVSKIVLPASKAKVNIVWTDAEKVIQSLLTDPRIRASDYLFYGNDPFQPPTQQNWIGDLNTGKAYIKTYEKLITKPNQVLLPTPLYIDGAATGQFANLPITAVQISLGIFNRKARDKPHFWRTLGYIPPVEKDKSRGKRMFIESRHLESGRARFEAQKNEGQITNKDAKPAQDFHTMLDKILESYVKIQNRGFIWDLFYNDTLYKDVEFIPFVPFIKCDTDEGDQLCGKYKARSKYVAGLCRYCKCPTDESDDHLHEIRHKTKAEISRLVRQNDLQKLKELSQQCIDNATYKLRFGEHNKFGVHSATPMEMLHAILLGIFKYVRDTFFEQCGPKSKLAKEVDALAREIGMMLHRQSDRDKPKTKFCNGIRKGKLMAKEYTGILLCMLLVLRSGKGRKLLGRRKKVFCQKAIDDWVMTLETLLEWEEWLKSDTMLKKHVRAAREKHRYIMYLIRKVANRTSGMGLKLSKFHGILHMADDILNFGVPMELDTGSNETGHKPRKAAAKLTQKSKETFEIQTATRMDEMHLLELAKEEIEGRPLWNYANGHIHDDQMSNNLPPKTTTGGAAFRFYTDQHGISVPQYAHKRKSRIPNYMVEKALTDFMVDLNDAFNVHCGEVLLFSQHTRNGQTFRSSAQYRGKVWRDWVWVDWDDDGILPNKIWGFVDLRQLPQNAGIDFGGLIDVAPAIYAVVESTQILENNSEIVLSFETDVVKNAQNKFETFQFFLADVEAFDEPAIVIPDVGGPPNAYLVLKSRREWRDSFEEWLEAPIEEDDMSDLEEIEEEDEDDISVDSGADEEDEGEDEGVDDESLDGDAELVTDDEGESEEESEEEEDDSDED